MRQYKKSANPFYALLIVAGIAFVVTAAAYCVMAYRDRAAATANATAEPDHPLMVWMREHGEVALLSELAMLALGTVGAIGTDDYWQRRASARD
jgi:hypothetical protein